MFSDEIQIKSCIMHSDQHTCIAADGHVLLSDHLCSTYTNIPHRAQLNSISGKSHAGPQSIPEILFRLGRFSVIYILSYICVKESKKW